MRRIASYSGEGAWGTIQIACKRRDFSLELEMWFAGASLKNFYGESDVSGKYIDGIALNIGFLSRRVLGVKRRDLRMNAWEVCKIAVEIFFGREVSRVLQLEQGSSDDTEYIAYVEFFSRALASEEIVQQAQRLI